jgi:hypothetical protein
MIKSVCVLAVLAAAVSTSAVAKDLKQDKKAPPVAATQMNDAEMDKVTAGAPGNGEAFGHLGPEAWRNNEGKGPKGPALGHFK